MNAIRIKSVIITVVATMMLLVVSNASNAQKTNKMNTNNIVMATYEYLNGNVDGVFKYTKQEIIQNPRNAYAYLYIGAVMIDNPELMFENRDDLIQYFDRAIKYMPKKDKSSLTCAYIYRAMCHAIINSDLKKTNADLNKALRYSPEEYLEDIYYYIEYINEVIKEYGLLFSDNSAVDFIELANSSIELGNYDWAIECLTKAIYQGEDLSDMYLYRSICYSYLYDIENAVNDAIKSFEIAVNPDAISQLELLAESDPEYVLSRITQCNVDDSSASWMHLLGSIYYDLQQYEKAFDYYTKAFSEDNNNKYLKDMYNSLYMMGDYENALEFMQQVMNVSSSYQFDAVNTAKMNYAIGDTDAAIKEVSRGIEKDLDNYELYVMRGNFYERNGDYKNALEDYETAISLKSTNPGCHLACGRVYQKIGNTTEAMKEFQYSIYLDDINGDYNVAPYAYFYMGENDKAKHALYKMLLYNENYYDAACMYSLLGQKTLAIESLKRSLENGNHNFFDIENNPSLSNVMNMSEFESTLSYYKEKMKALALKNSEIINSYEVKTVEIPFTMNEGVMEVKCDVNGYEFPFIFDTGASDVLITRAEFDMMENDYSVTDADKIGHASYCIADGTTITEAKINLKSLKIGGLEIKDVVAAVSENKSASRLLGLSALQRFGKLEIDVENSKIIVKCLRVKEEI